MLKPPTEQEIHNYVAATHTLDRVSITTGEIQSTWKQQGLPNPYAQGHFRAFMYVIHKLLPSNDFPAKEGASLNTLQDSHTALFWLREIHHKMTDPLIGHPLTEDDINSPKAGQIGRYRLTPTMAVTKPAPAPEIIPRLMHNWLIEYATFHEKIKGKVNNPYGLSRDEAFEVYRKTNEVNLFFCTVQPLACLNQRMGRFLENTFRCAWKLPIKLSTSDYQSFSAQLEKYQDETLPKLVIASNTVRG